MRTSPRRTRPAATVAAAAHSPTDPKRRQFLLTLGVGAAGTTVAALPAAAAIGATAADSESDAGYRETAHVRDYYRTAKL